VRREAKCGLKYPLFLGHIFSHVIDRRSRIACTASMVSTRNQGMPTSHVSEMLSVSVTAHTHLDAGVA